MEKRIELFEIVYNDDDTKSLIAECNGYIDNEFITQYSRSPFVFSSTLNDDDIISLLWDNEYKIYL